MSTSKFRKIIGIFWVMVFVFALFGAASRFGSLNFSSLKSKIESFFKTGIKVNEETITKKIINEESAAIDVVDSVSPSVVSVVVKTVDLDLFNGPISSQEGIGTGFIVDSKGVIVTNSHVVDNPESQYSVVLKDGTVYDVQKIHLDEFSDLAILEIAAINLPAVTLGDSTRIKVGQMAVAIGNALGRYQNTVTVGVVSGVARQLTASSPFGDTKTYENVIQTDAAVNPGNSGGPLLNSAGQVIGINVATTIGAQNISFAIPINTLKPILESFLLEGKIVRPYLGVTYTMITRELAKLRRLPIGAFVSRVLPDSPARKAGFQRGDIITKFDGGDLNDDLSLSAAVSKKKIGDSVDIVVSREDKLLTLHLILEELPKKP